MLFWQTDVFEVKLKDGTLMARGGSTVMTPITTALEVALAEVSWFPANDPTA